MPPRPPTKSAASYAWLPLAIKHDVAQAIVDSVVRGSRGSDGTHTDVIQFEDLASYYAWIGDVGAAAEWVDRAFALSPNGIDPTVMNSALFDEVREQPLFAEAIREVRMNTWERVRIASGN